ncbi:MAG: VOC family virulence protein [Gammaproteobacteria bacterium]|nr:VOC family virulence protein [Gammaproteobacteria bacterium]
MSIAGFDHAAIPIADVNAMLRFYEALGCEVVEVQPPLFYSVVFGDNKINFHGPEAWQSGTFTLRGPTARPGCGDFCFVWDGLADELAEMLARADAPVVEGPVPRVGGRGETGTSTYIRDPDGNLLEFIVYAAGAGERRAAR